MRISNALAKRSEQARREPHPGVDGRLRVTRARVASPGRSADVVPGMATHYDCSGNPAIRRVNAPGPEALRPRLTAGLLACVKTIAPDLSHNQLCQGGDSFLDPVARVTSKQSVTLGLGRNIFFREIKHRL
jgi:hypothetical protein